MGNGTKFPTINTNLFCDIQCMHYEMADTSSYQSNFVISNVQCKYLVRSVWIRGGKLITMKTVVSLTFGRLKLGIC